MALSIDRSKVSEAAWGSVDKAAMGKKLASAYAAGEVTKAQIRFVYLHVPDEAFGKDSEGKPEFLYSKAKLPVCEVTSSSIVLNRAGAHAAAGALAGARTMPDMSASELSAAKRKLRGMYRKMKEKPPKSMMDSVVVRIERGKPLIETAKGSLEYLLAEIASDFNAQFQEHSPYGGMWCPYRVEDTFADAVIVRESWSVDTELEPDEYYRVVYSYDSAIGKYDFASQDKWETVELAYRPASTAEKVFPDVTAINDSKSGPNGRKRFQESVEGAIEFAESEPGTVEARPDGPWRIKAIGLTADVVNGNGRRRRAAVVTDAVGRLRGHLHESAGQGRVITQGVTTGEPDHPRDKGNRRPLLSETVVNWDTVEFNGKHVLLEGNLLGTVKGKDIRAQMQGGVVPGLSQRSYGDSVIVEESGEKVEEVTWETITGYDLTPPTLQSDADSSVTMFETLDQGDDDMLMTAEDLRKLIAENPTLFDAVIGERVKTLTDAQVLQFQESLRGAIGVKPEDDLFAAVRSAADAKKKMDEQAAGKLVEDAIIAETKDLPYGADRNKLFVEGVRSLEPKTVEEVKRVVAAQRKSYDALFAGQQLRDQGFSPSVVAGQGGRPVLLVESVIEKELGIPEYGRIGFEFSESLVRAGYAPRRDMRKPKTINEQFAALVLARFDEVNRNRLIHEMKQLQEAGEQVSDLSLPYSVSRAVIPEVMAQLIAASVFDVGVTDQAPTRIFYEKYVAESGTLVTIIDESVDPGLLDVWVDMAFKRVIPGSVTVTNIAGNVTYVEGEDYVLDYANGRLLAMSTGDITASTAVEVDYQYDAIRLGELAPIERGKMQLSTKTMEIAADRLAQEISTEALVFGRSQLGWDAQARTINSLIQQVRRKIDQGLFRLALASSLLQVTNSGGTWSVGTDDIQDFVNYIGVARVKVAKRFYRPTSILMSTTNADLVANWVGFTQAGSRPDATLNAEGYVGSLKGLPVFHSTEFPDNYALVFNKEIVAYRVFQAMTIKGPYPTYDPSSAKLIAADQFYVEEFNGTSSLIPEKASHVVITA